MNEKVKILVVDDEEVVLKSVNRILTREGYQTDEALSADIALKKIKEATYDVIVTDWKMPGIDGMELIARIKEMQPETFIIMITGYSSVDSAVKAMSLGAFDYISKPFTPGDIAVAVDKALKEKKTIEAVILKADMDSFVEELIAEARVVGARRKGASFVFDGIENPRELCLDYNTTILPLKKFFLPQEEVLLEFDTEEKNVRVPEIPQEEKIFFGIHPCDMQAILKLDYAFSRGNAESNYLIRRSNALFIGVICSFR